METIAFKTMVLTGSDAIPILPIIPGKEQFHNITEYTFLYLKKHFESVKVNEDFSYISISSDDLKKFLNPTNTYLNDVFNFCPEGMDQLEIGNIILLDNSQLRVIHTGRLAKVFHNSLNRIWGYSILWRGVEDIIYSKTLPGSARGLLTQRPLAALTIGAFVGVTLSFSESYVTWPLAKRIISNASFFCLVPTKLTEVLLNKAGGRLVALPWVSRAVSRLGIEDVKLNFTSQVVKGPGASVTDFKVGREASQKFFKFLADPSNKDGFN